MRISLKGFIYHKASESFDDCADRYSYNIHNHKFAISDGVSKSFFPRVWSEILVDQYVNSESDITSLEEILPVCQDEWLKKIEAKVKSTDVKWYTKSQYNNKVPALATFVGLSFNVEKQTWNAEVLGDSFLFFLPKGADLSRMVELSSKEAPITFDNFPDYYTSIGDNHKGAVKKEERKIETGTFYLMTDALAEWFIKNKENAIRTISEVENQEEFKELINYERANKFLTDDDSAILILEVEKKTDSTLTLDYSSITISDVDKLIDQGIIAINDEIEEEEQPEEIVEIEVNPVKDEDSEQNQEGNTIVVDDVKEEQTSSSEVEEKVEQNTNVLNPELVKSVTNKF